MTKAFTIPFYILGLLLFLIVILLLIIIWLLSRDRKQQRPGSADIDRIQDEIDASLEDLKLQISKKLNSLSEASTEDLIEKETIVAKDIRTGIVKTRKKIDDKLTKAKRRKPAAAEKLANSE